MRLSVSYNFFNGEEHLRASLSSVRSEVDFISIVYQTVSNAGLQIHPDSVDLLHQLQGDRLVDKLFLYNPDFRLSRAENELVKRRIGLELARESRCTHFFTMDSDEFYRERELRHAKQYVVHQRLNSTSASSYFHVLRPRWRAFDTTRVAFITEVGLLTRFFRSFYPVRMVDPTRRLFTFPRRHYHFDPSLVAMFHMNLVRHDFAGKFANSSNIDPLWFRDLSSSLACWRPGERFDFGRKGRFDVFEVSNEFATFDPGDPVFWS